METWGKRNVIEERLQKGVKIKQRERESFRGRKI